MHFWTIKIFTYLVKRKQIYFYAYVVAKFICIFVKYEI